LAEINTNPEEWIGLFQVSLLRLSYNTMTWCVCVCVCFILEAFFILVTKSLIFQFYP
jgi:hypothetical protein